MGLVFRFASVTQAEINQALMEINPLKPGETIEVYANADAAGDTLEVKIGTKTAGSIDLGVETAVGVGPLVPDNIVTKWTQPPGLGQQDVSMIIGGDNIDLLLIKS